MLVAQGTEAGGHCGEISTMVLIPEVVDAVGPDVPVLAAGGIATGRQMTAALALGAQGVWTGSQWLTVAEANTSPVDHGTAARGDVARHGAFARVHRQARAPAAQRVDRGVRRSAKAPARCRCRCRASSTKRRRAGSCACNNKELTGFPVGQIVGRLNEVRPTKDVIFDMVEEWIATTERLNGLLGD